MPNWLHFENILNCKISMLEAFWNSPFWNVIIVDVIDFFDVLKIYCNFFLKTENFCNL